MEVAPKARSARPAIVKPELSLYTCGPEIGCLRSFLSRKAAHSWKRHTNRKNVLGLAPGFTLIELMVTMLIIAILAGIAIPSFVGSLRAARESNLKKDLHVMRVAIDNYTNDKEKAPQSLDDLVSAGYLQSIPVDPMTHSSSTWVPTMDDSLQSIDQTDPGMTDVHSGSDGVSEDGQPYSSW